MSTPLTVDFDIHFTRRGRGYCHVLESCPAPAEPEPMSAPAPFPGRVPRIARLMALAIRFEGLIKAGTIPDYAELARLGRVTRARMTQIMNLLLLAPDIQEQLLFLPSIRDGRDRLYLKDLQPIAAQPDWRKQRPAFAELQKNSEAASACQ